MRRQVKPFVTEYRGAIRRGKDQPEELHSEVQTSRNRSYAEAEKLFQSEPSEDSYEAALRAADALFDPSARNSIKPHHEGVVSGGRHEPVRHSTSPLDELSDGTAKQGFAVGTVPSEASAPSPTVGPRRILQALETPVEDKFAALEAERAPKRRGRKPGSKNKIKEVGDDWQTPAIVKRSFAAVATVGVDQPLISAEPADGGSIAALGNEEPLSHPRGRNNRFGWKRAGLRPGERWKRRLPKTARKDTHR